MSSTLAPSAGDGRPEAAEAKTSGDWRRGLRRAAMAIVAVSVMLVGLSAGSAGAAGWTWGAMGTPPGVSIASGIGAVGVQDSPTAATRPYVFLRGSDSHLWSQYWTGRSWVWSDQGTPPNVAVASGIGVAGVKDSPTSATQPYVFVLGNDGHIWADEWSGSAWNWSDLIHPPGVAVSSVVGVTTVMDSATSAQRPYIFVIGSDGHLWSEYWNGSDYVWYDQGVPPTTSISSGIGATAVLDSPTSGQRPYVFVRGGDGHLWSDYWTGSNWAWYDQGAPLNLTVAATVGVTTVRDTPTSSTRPYVFVRGSDGHLWSDHWTGGTWLWTDQSAPYGGSVAATVGVTTVMDSPTSAQRAYAFVRGSDGHLWSKYWTGRAFAWIDQGVPTGTSISSGLGVMTVMDSPTSGQRPYVFVLGGDGNLWTDYWG